MTSGIDVASIGLADGVGAWFTGARIEGIADANLAHHVPHIPGRLGEARAQVATLTRTDVGSWHLMRQVHGAEVGIVDGSTPPGAELRNVDIIVTALSDRPLVVLTADCLPILAAGRRTVAAAHAGWRGIAARVPDVLVDALCREGERPEELHIAIGPAIGPCCYAVGPEVHAAVTEAAPEAGSVTLDGRISLDLRHAARSLLVARGVRSITDVGGEGPGSSVCTSCDHRWFSHRRDPRSGRQAGIIVRRSTAPSKDLR